MPTFAKRRSSLAVETVLPMLRSFSPKEILARELAQLKAAYLARHDLPRAAASIDRLLILDDRDPFCWGIRAS